MLRRRNLSFIVCSLAIWAGAALASAQTTKPSTGGGRDQEPAADRPQRGGGAPARPGQGQGQEGDSARPGQPGGGGQRNPFGGFNDPAEQLRRLRNEVSTRPRNTNGGPGGGGPGGGMMMMMGGGGGGAGIWGLLMRSRPLQEEIKMTEEQKQALQEINTNAREKMRDVTRQAFQGGGRGQQGGQGGGGRGQFNIDPQQIEAMQVAMNEMRIENEAAIKRVVKPAQLKRLNEIRLRILGPFAVAEQDVAEELPLNPQQYEQILAIMAQYDQELGALMQEQFRGMGNMFGRGRGGNQPGGAPGAPGAPGAAGAGRRGQAPGAGGDQAEAPQNVPQNRARPGRNADNNNDEDAQDPPARPANRARNGQGNDDADSDETAVPARGNRRQQQGRDNGDDGEDEGGRGGQQGQGGGRGRFNMTPEQQAEIEARIAETRKKTEDIEKRAEAAIRKVLTPANRSKFNKMLGADFDLTKLAQADQRGPQNGRGGRDGANGDPQAPGARRPPADQSKTAPAGEDSGDDSKSAPAQPRTRPQPRVRGGSN